MKPLKCDVSPDYSLSVTPSTSSEDFGIELAIRRKNSESVLVSRRINWPNDVQLPTEVFFESESSLIRLRSTMTSADIPFKYVACSCSNFAVCTRCAGCPPRSPRKTLALEAANPQPSLESDTLLNAILAFSQNYKDSKAWKSLKRASETAGIPNLSNQLTAAQQKSLINGLAEKIDTNSFGSVCTTLCKADIFSYWVYDEFSKLLSKSPECLSLLLTITKNSTIITEHLYSLGLAVAAELQMNVSTLTTTQVALLVTHLVNLLCNEKETPVQSQIVRLLTVLIDAHGSRLVWDEATHEKILTAAGVLCDMAALTDSYTTLEALRKERSKIATSEEAKPYVIKKCQLKPTFPATPKAQDKTSTPVNGNGEFTPKRANATKERAEEPLKLSAFSLTVEGPKSVVLPKQSIELIARLENESLYENVSLSYQWEVLSGNGLAVASAYNRPNLILGKLKAGTILVRATVKGEDIEATAEHSLIVSEAKLESKPPVALIRPEGPINSVEGNTLTLDAEGSKVSSPPATFEWSQLSGPTVTLSATNVPSLHIDRLVKGVYKFQVIVRDADDREDIATVVVNVAEERDDPPKAHITECGQTGATGSVTVRLPQDVLKLCANTSQDDKGIVEFRWFRIDPFTNELTVDNEGSTTAELTLKHLQVTENVGAYEFALEVTDGKKQKDSTKVSIFVHAAKNLPPVPNGGGNRTILLPQSSLVLEGNAQDDGEIKYYNWTQMSGPNNATIINANRVKATVSGLIEGKYSFRLTVVDDGGLEASDTVYIDVARGANRPPVAVAANVTVSLPDSVIKLDGSKSHDDAGITYFKWIPDEDTPASLQILTNSDSEPILIIGNLVEGTFRFNFTVRDQQGEFDQKWVTLDVVKGEAEMQSVELFLRQPIAQFTFAARWKLENRIAAVLTSAQGIPSSTTIQVRTTAVGEEASSGLLRIVFYAEVLEHTEEMRRRRGAQAAVLSGDTVVDILRLEKSMKQSFAIERIETKYCHLTCSGRGKCLDRTKQCVCDRFWMPSVFSLIASGGKYSDCEWSIVYFTICSVLFLLAVAYYFFVRKSLRSSWSRKAKRLRYVAEYRSRDRFRRRRRYSPVQSEDSDLDVHTTKRNTRSRNTSAQRLQALPKPPSSDSLLTEAEDLLPHTVPRSSFELHETKRLV